MGLYKSEVLIVSKFILVLVIMDSRSAALNNAKLDGLEEFYL